MSEHRRTIITAGIAAAATLVVTIGLGYLFTTFGAGLDAADEAQIREVVGEMLVTDSGKTHAQVLVEVNLTLRELVTKVDRIEDDIDDINGAVTALARSSP